MQLRIRYTKTIVYEAVVDGVKADARELMLAEAVSAAYNKGLWKDMSENDTWPVIVSETGRIPIIRD